MPRALWPWRTALSVLPRDIQSSLGPWLGRLTRAIGPLHRSQRGEEGPPDGFAGLGRHGPYERLLMSEWLLAEEVPDEFLRRAAALEQLFLQLARRQPAGALRSVVLIDAGPSQLGSPRVGHLAVAVVLAQRALDAGAGLEFGVLQSSPPLTTGLSTRAAEGLVRTRSARPPDPEDWDRWRDAILQSDPSQTPYLDLWLVGGPAIWHASSADGAPEWIESAHRIDVRDVLEPDRRALLVTVHGRARPSPVELPLPPASACVRILRAPYVAPPAVSPSSVHGRVAAMRFSYTDHHLMVSTSLGVSALRLKLRERDYSTRPVILDTEGEAVIAADTYKQSFFILTSAEHGFRVRSYRRSGDLEQTIDLPDHSAFVRPGADAGFGPFLPLGLSGGSRRMVTVDALNNVFIARAEKGGELYGPVSQALAIARTAKGVNVLIQPWGEQLVNVFIDRNGQRHDHMLSRVEGEAAFFVATSERSRPPIAARRGDEWSLDGWSGVVVAPAARTVGATMFRFSPGATRPSLVGLSEDRQRLTINSVEAHETTIPLPWAPVEVVVGNVFPLVAVRSEAGAVRVWHLESQRIVGELAP